MSEKVGIQNVSEGFFDLGYVIHVSSLDVPPINYSIPDGLMAVHPMWHPLKSMMQRVIRVPVRVKTSTSLPSEFSIFFKVKLG